MFPAPLEGEWLKRVRHDSRLIPNARFGCCVLVQRMGDDGGPSGTVTILRRNETIRLDEVVVDFAPAKLAGRVGEVGSWDQLVFHVVPIQFGPRCRRRVRGIRRAEEWLRTVEVVCQLLKDRREVPHIVGKAPRGKAYLQQVVRAFKPQCLLSRDRRTCHWPRHNLGLRRSDDQKRPNFQPVIFPNLEITTPVHIG